MKLEIKGVTKTFKAKTAVNNFSMVVETGQCVGLIAELTVLESLR
ncbi:ABC transporter ATP-binding protein OS=Lysinibacillus sphaericus OX=1421 GN=LS41612_15020 PE=4 SV=1 [Lysinibacillus sphaericus]